MWKNTDQSYGLVAKSLHWLSAITIIALFILGYWMVDLTYYSEWYKTAPHWHKSVGILLLIATLFRCVWGLMGIKPSPIAGQSKLVQKSASLAHALLYVLMFTIMVSGYLISTADGRAIEVFTWFAVPSLGELFTKQEDIAGAIHEYAAYSIMAVAILHALAAIKHHTIDKDDTLRRMIK